MNTAVEFEQDNKTIGEYINVFKRRKKYLLIPASIILVIALMIAMLWPPTFQSSATILIEEQQIPQDLVASTVTSYAAQQIESIKARIMTMKNIMGLVEKYNLYDDDELKAKGRTQIVGQFIKNVGLDVLSAGIIDPKSGRATEATIAFSLSFRHSSPVKAQKVASELVNLYLNENLRDRTAKSTSTSEFLNAEVDALAGMLDEQGKKLAEFKVANEGSLPELFAYNMGLVDRSERELLDVSLRIKELKKQKLQLQSDLAQISQYAPTVMPDGQRVLSDYDRLKALKSEYRRKVAVYSDEHPDVIRLGREIEVLEVELGIELALEEYDKQLKMERDVLSALKEKYTSDHPKVLVQQRVIDQLKTDRPDPNAVRQVAEASPDNPAWVLLDTQLKSVEVEMQILEENKKELRKKIKEYEDKILNAPMVEKTYLEMQRDYESTSIKYKELKAKLMTAELAQTLEQGRKGERFTLIDPPAVPEEPVSPNRPAIVFLGVVFAIAGGFGFVILAEALTPTVRGRRVLTNIVGVSPLVEIPYIEVVGEQTKKSYIKYYLLGAAVFAMSIAAALIHFYITPLDVLWFKVLRSVFGISA